MATVDTVNYSKLPCCPELAIGPTCDVMDLYRRLRFPTTVKSETGQQLVVEVILRTQFKRCSGPLALGDLAYSTTLLPGETVRLLTTDRRSRFSFDSESNLSYRSEQLSEEQYRMSSLRAFMSDEQSTDNGSSRNTDKGSWDFHGDTSGSIGFLSASADANANGNHNAESTFEYMQQHSAHARMADRYGKEIDSLSGAILLPVADEASVLGLLDNIGITYQKGKDGIYTHRTNKNVDVFFRFANKYLYVTSVNAESIQLKNLPDPAKALTIPGDATISFLARIDRMPQAAKKLALDHLEEAINATKKDGLPNETKSQADFRTASLDDMHKFAKSVLADAADLRLDLDVNDTTKELAVNFSITAKPQSALAKTIADLGNLNSPLTAVLPKDAAFRGAFHFAMPASMHKAFESVIQEASAKSLAGIQDANKRKEAETLFNSLMPSAKSGEYQVVAAVIGPKADRYSFLAAIKLKDGLKLGATVRDLIADAAKQVPAAEKGKIQLDFDSVGAAKIHKFEAPKIASLDAILNDIASDRFVYVAFRDDALFLGLGADSLTMMKSALAKTDAAQSSPLHFDMDVARMAKWLARTPQQKDQAAKLAAAGDNSRILINIEGGSSLRASVRTHFSVLEFLVKLADQKGK